MPEAVGSVPCVMDRDVHGIIVASQIVMAFSTHLFSISALFPGVSEFQRRIDTMSFIVVLTLALGALGFVAVLTLVRL
jgi:hypothetical protein